MYQFTARTQSLKVCLHDASGQDIGIAAFRDGVYRTGDAGHARALARAMPGLVEYGVTQLTQIPEPEPEAAAPEPSPEAEDDPEEDAEDEPDPAPTTESKPARRGRRKGRIPHAPT